MPWKHGELSLPGVSVQQLLEQHQPAVIDPTNSTTNPLAEEDDEDDVFQCGKCKIKFSSLSIFVEHKKVCPLKNSVSGDLQRMRIPSVSSSFHTVQRNQLDQSSQMLLEPPSASLGPSVINLNESDLLSLAGGIANSSGLALNDNSNGALGPDSILGSSPANSQQHYSSSHIPNLTTTASLNDLINSSPISVTSSSANNSGTHTTQLISNNGQTTTIGLPLSFVSGSTAFTLPASLLVTTTAGGDNSGDLSHISIPPNVIFNISNDGVSNADRIGIVVTEQQQPPQNIQGSLSHGPTPHKKSKKKLQKATSSGPSTKSQQQLQQQQHQVTINLTDDLLPVPEGLGEGKGPKKAPKLQCTFCSRAFHKNFDLQQHIRCHTGEKPFQCIVCGRAFAQKSNVKKHMQTHKVWPDGLAHTLPSGAESETGDEENMSQEEDFSDVREQRALQAVIQGRPRSGSSGQLKRPDYMCPYCRSTAKTYFELKSHMKTHKREKVYKCIQGSCGKMFAELEDFLEHIQAHETEMTYRCHQCSKSFSNLHDLGTHQYSHTLFPNQSNGRQTQSKYYRCQKCLNKYTTPAALEHHLATSTHHYPCSQCNKVFPCERYLRRHLVTHGQGLHECQFCEKTFKTANYLKVHLVIHTGAKPFTCNVCPAAFNRRDKLKRHKLVHDPVKKYKCPFRSHTGCTKEFNRPDKLKAHILTHSGVKPHTCTHCGRSFSRRAHLRSHLVAHQSTTVVHPPPNQLTQEDSQEEEYQEGDGGDRSDGGFITFYDCSSCGNLFTNEADCKSHVCVINLGSQQSLNMIQDKVRAHPVYLGKKKQPTTSSQSFEHMDKAMDLMTGYNLTETGLQPPLNLLNDETSKGDDSLSNNH